MIPPVGSASIHMTHLDASSSQPPAELLWQAVVEGRLAYASEPSHFRTWADHCLAWSTPEQWQFLLSQVVSKQLQAEVIATEAYQEVFLHLLLEFLQNNLWQSAQHMYRLLTAIQAQGETSQIWPSLDRLSKTIQQVSQQIDDPTLVIRLREWAFEIDPENIDNLLKLVIACAEADEDFKTAIYAASAAEVLIPQKRHIPSHILTILFDKQHYEAFFQLAETWVQSSDPQQDQAPLYGFLAQLARYYLPERYESYEGLWQPQDLANQQAVGDFLTAVFQNSLSSVQSCLGEALEELANSPYITEVQKLYLMGDAASYYGHSVRTRDSQRLIQIMFQDWPIERIRQLGQTDEYDKKTDYIVWVLLFRFCFTLAYQNDDIALLRSYQAVTAQVLGQMTRSKHKTLGSYTPQPTNYTTTEHSSRPLRVGYLSSTFYGHSVGYLSHQAVGYHDPRKVEVYCYLYDRIDKSKLYKDKITLHLQSHIPHFRNLIEASLPEIVQAIRTDKLDILIYLDTLTNSLGCEVVAHRVAPCQVSWLGGDSPGLPELDYFLVDPYILDDKAQEFYSEQLLRLSTFAAVDEFDQDDIDIDQFRRHLNIPDYATVFWSTSNSHKRNRECITSQLEILRQVPDSVLVVRGIGDIPVMVSVYKEIAQEKGVTERLRFLARASSPERHRAELGLADLLLDTFPYTGATQTMEALWRGVPVLTKVGRHYYGRMSYTQLKNCGLDQCITWSVEEYIQRGVELGQNPEMLQAVQKKVRDSRLSSCLWDARAFARQLEAAYQHMAQGKPGSEFQLPNPEKRTASEWNQAGLVKLRSLPSESQARERVSAWEEAVVCWRQGLAVDPEHLPCRLNRLHGLLVLGDRSRSLREGVELLEQMLMDPHKFTYDNDLNLAMHLAWPLSNYSSVSSTSLTKAYLHYLARWLAEHLGVVYRPEVVRYWRLAFDLIPEDSTSKLVIALHLLSQNRVEGLYYIQNILTMEPENERARVAAEVAKNTLLQSSREKTAPIKLSYYNYQMSLEPTLTSVATFTLLGLGRWFEGEIDLCQEILKPVMQVIDVGANVGVYTFLFAQQVGQTGKVYAFEPAKSCAELLRQTVDANYLGDNVAIYETAVGDYVGEAQLEVHESSAFNTLVNKYFRERNDALETVSITTLDDAWEKAGMPSINLIKIDAEGSEVEVLRGGQKLLDSCEPIVIFENWHGNSTTGLGSVEYLQQLSYSFLVYLPYVNALKFVKPEKYPVSNLNIVAIKEKHLRELKHLIL